MFLAGVLLLPSPSHGQSTEVGSNQACAACVLEQSTDILTELIALKQQMLDDINTLLGLTGDLSSLLPTVQLEISRLSVYQTGK